MKCCGSLVFDQMKWLICRILQDIFVCVLAYFFDFSELFLRFPIDKNLSF